LIRNVTGLEDRQAPGRPIYEQIQLAIPLQFAKPVTDHHLPNASMTKATLLLVDNGSSRPESTLNLRRIATRLAETIGEQVHPVSLRHADKVSASLLGGAPANTFVPFLQSRLRRNERRFIVLPLFFGPSRALTSYIPEQSAQLAREHGEFELQQCPELCPLPQGEPRLARILCDQLPARQNSGQQQVILVDHGSPIPSVTAVRHYLAEAMRHILGPDIHLREAVMERREGTDYDFNGVLLEELLRQAGEEDDRTPIALSLLFMSPGRHAGPGGDIEAICRRIGKIHKGWPIETSDLIGDHEGLIPILRERLAPFL
jgi:sirohydrochlorin ferrochelatase